MSTSPHTLTLKHCWLCSALLILPPAAQATEYQAQPIELRVSHERLHLPAGESMGLVGINALLEVSDYGYLGIAGYSAVTGQRGGFFSVGYNAGLTRPLTKKVRGEAQLFLGGGGGGAAPQGDGLMLREQLGLVYQAEGYRLGAGVSRIHFRHGQINSTQPYLSLEFPFTVVATSGWQDTPLEPGQFPLPLSPHASSLALSWKQYRGSTLFKAGQPATTSFSLLGVEWRHQLGKHLYYSLSTHGAYQGGADGYMEVMTGAGYQRHLTPSTALGVGVAFGAGGGGNVDSGGGALGELTLGLEQALGRTLLLSLQGGYTKAASGGFGGTTLGLALGSRWLSPSTSAWNEELPDLVSYQPRHYRLKVVQQRYYPATAIPRLDSPASGIIDLSGVQIERYSTDHLYVAGQAMAARGGMAGGYASGMVGGGLRLPLNDRVAMNVELLAGAGGGGGVDVGGGLVAGATAGVIVGLGRSLELQLGAGRITAVGGGLNARQLTASLAYRFTLPQR